MYQAGSIVLISLLFDPEDFGCEFPGNNELLPNCKALHIDDILVHRVENLISNNTTIAQKTFSLYTRQETIHQTTKEPSLMLGKGY
jgi:hypothetical protein